MRLSYVDLVVEQSAERSDFKAATPPSAFLALAVIDKAGDAALHKGQEVAGDAIKDAGAKFAKEKVPEAGGENSAGPGYGARW